MLGAVLLVVAAGCGSSGTAKSKPPAKSPSKAVTLAQVKTLLPAPADVGDGYKIDTSGDSNSDDPAMDKAIKAQCPQSADLINGSAVDPNEAQRSYVAPDGRTVDVTLSPDAAHSVDFGTEAQLAADIKAIASCPSIDYVEDDGSHVVMKMQATSSRDYGDVGVLLDLDITVSGGGLPHPIDVPVRVRVFEAGDIGVVVDAAGGVVPRTTTVIPYDDDAVEHLSRSLADKAAALQR